MDEEVVRSLLAEGNVDGVVRLCSDLELDVCPCCLSRLHAFG